MNKYDYKKIIPLRFQEASFEKDLTPEQQEIIINSLRKKEGLYLWGMPGSGKTHKACAIAKFVLTSGIQVKYYNTGDFLEMIREEFERTDEDEDSDESLFRETMNFQGLLILDDIGAEKATPWVQERLYLIINKRYEDIWPTIFTSNCDMEVLSARLGDRISSRIVGMTKNIKINGSDKRINENH
jgi:DNA replication protein DnaC